MDSKYYTPTIDEFYPGFEYEHSCGSVRFAMLDLSGKEKTVEGEPTKIWIKHIFSGNEFDIWKAAFDFESALKNGQIRVKCLDEEDIISLGIELIDKKSSMVMDVPIEDYDILYKIADSMFMRYLSWYESKDGKPEKHEFYKIYYKKKNDIYFIPDTRYFGKIRNKSELEKLLRQLDIYENSQI